MVTRQQQSRRRWITRDAAKGGDVERRRVLIGGEGRGISGQGARVSGDGLRVETFRRACEGDASDTPIDHRECVL